MFDDELCNRAGPDWEEMGWSGMVIAPPNPSAKQTSQLTPMLA